LAGRKAPEAIVAAELATGLVDDRPRLGPEAVAREEVAVVAAGEEARLLGVGARGDLQAGGGRLGSGVRLRLLAEREPEAVEQRRVDGCEHVRLVLRRVGGAGDEQTPVALDDARVVAGGEARRAGAPHEPEQLSEAESAVAARARVRGLAAAVRAHERRHDGAAEVLARVERHVRETALVAGAARPG